MTDPGTPSPVSRPPAGGIRRALATALATFLFARLFADELLYWYVQRLYWEGVTHPDGGDHEEEAEIHAAEGAQTALRRVATLAGVRPHAIPDHASANSMALDRLREELNARESRALKTLERLGPSRDLAIRERTRDHIDAGDAETTLEQCKRVREYLDWLTEMAS